MAANTGQWRRIPAGRSAFIEWFQNVHVAKHIWLTITKVWVDWVEFEAFNG